MGTGIYRVCDLCGGVDDGPRHVFAGTLVGSHPVNLNLEPAVGANLEVLYNDGKINWEQCLSILGDFRDTSSSDRHIGCCADAGCPTGTCKRES